jgi:tetratricopeptide (TPR) repeat protein
MTSTSHKTASPAGKRQPLAAAPGGPRSQLPLLFAAIAFLFAASAGAADIPPLAEIEPALAAAHPDLVKQRAALRKERDAMRDATRRHNQACSQVEPGSAADARCSKALATLTSQVDRHIQASNTYNDQHRIAVLQATPHTDTTVVDARGPRDGAYLVDQVPELKASPAADRIAKGFQALILRQWPVALAWWQEALQRDPGNAALKRSVALAQWMVDRRNAVAAGPVTPIGAAFYSASRGDVGKAISQFELAKKDNPAIAPQAERMVFALRQRQARDAANAAYWNQQLEEATRLVVDGLREVGMNRLSIGDEQGAQTAFMDADLFAAGWPTGK